MKAIKGGYCYWHHQSRQVGTLKTKYSLCIYTLVKYSSLELPNYKKKKKMCSFYGFSVKTITSTCNQPLQGPCTLLFSTVRIFTVLKVYMHVLIPFQINSYRLCVLRRMPHWEEHVWMLAVSLQNPSSTTPTCITWPVEKSCRNEELSVSCWSNPLISCREVIRSI